MFSTEENSHGLDMCYFDFEKISYKYMHNVLNEQIKFLLTGKYLISNKCTK